MPSTSLSVIIPTYNRSEYLPQAVASALAQEGVDVEVIIVDDGSTDETATVIEQCRSYWGERARYIWQENSERSVARNHGLRYARGEFLAFLDSDDIWMPDHARLCLAALRSHPQVVAAYGEYGLMTADGRPIHNQVARPASTGKQFLLDLCLKRLILHPTEVVLRRTAITSNELFDPEIPGAEDWLLWVELASRGGFARVGQPTVWMRSHPKGTFGDPRKFTRSLMKAAEKVVATGLPSAVGIDRSQILAINRTHCAYAYYLSGETRESRRLLWEALRSYPRALWMADFWRVIVRLGVGERLARRIRAMRNRGRGAAIEITPSESSVLS
ncbi:MAG: glycosyltransferase family A protein [Blastocatellia bacterium]